MMLCIIDGRCPKAKWWMLGGGVGVEDVGRKDGLGGRRKGVI